jgi:dipeptidyl aminopeptidase/acylaminoacyl peptidase
MKRAGQSLLLLAALYATAVFSQSIPTSSFFNTDGLTDVRISPNGSRIAMVLSMDNFDRIMILTTNDYELVTQTSTQEGQIINDYQWKGNDEIIVATSRIGIGRSRALPSGELFAFHVPSATGRTIAGSNAGEQAINTLSHILPSNPDQILVTRFEFTGRNLDSRPRGANLSIPAPAADSSSAVRISNELRGPLNGGELFADNQGVFRLAVANNDDNARLRYRTSADADWENISDQFSRTAADQVLSVEAVGFSEDNNSFFFLARDSASTKALMKYDAGSITTLLESESFDINQEDLVYAINSSEVIGVRLAGDYVEPNYFSQHQEVALQQKLDSFFSGERIQVTSADADKNLIAFKVSSPHRIGDFFLFNAENESLSQLGSTNSELKPEQMADVNAFAIRNSAGLTLHGYVTVPAGTETALPTVVIPNELPVGSRALPEFNRVAQFLAHHGYAVLQINTRGSSGFGLNHQLAGTGEWGTGIIDDITLAVRWAVQREIASEDSICLFGTSYGGFAAVASVIDQPERYQCAAALSGFYDLSSINTNRAPYLPVPEARQATRDSMDLNPAERLEQSPSENVDAIQVPLLLAHGARDTLTSFDQAEDFVEALQEANKAHEFFVKQDEGHNFNSSENRVEFFDKLVDFLDENLK